MYWGYTKALYRKGLSVKAAAWFVRKQSRHRTISEQAMKDFEEYQKRSK